MAMPPNSWMGASPLDQRLEDYLDDKFQSLTDLENLDALLESVEHQRSQLQAQLDVASNDLEKARHSAEEVQAALARKIDQFQTLQHSIDVRIQIVASSDAPDEAIRRLEQPLKQLHNVDLAHKYLILLQDVDTLRQEARLHLPQSPMAALEPYTRLKQLSSRLLELQVPSKGVATHVVTYVASIAKELWTEMKDVIWKEMEGILKRRGWPQVDPGLVVDEEWIECFEKSMDLQIPEVLYTPGIVSLLPIDIMADIFSKEFRYHFMSDKPTSNPQKIDTHCFPWFLALLERWEDFFRDNFGPVLAAKFHNMEASAKMVYIDPVCALITSMLPVMRKKLDLTMGEALEDGAFFSRLMTQLMTFDETIRSMFNYDGGDVEKGWDGLTSELLSKHFDSWLKAEKLFAINRFQAIMTSSDARNIDYEYAGPGKTKPTYGAVQVTDLLRTVTGQYERIRNFSHKLKFLIDIQIAILDEYHDRLRGSLEVYQSLTTTVGRTLHGVPKDQLVALEGTGAFETLCKVYGSSDHIVNTLEDWGNQELFVDMWEQLQSKTKKNEDQSVVAGGMSYDEVKDGTASAAGTENDYGDLFDETRTAYSHWRKRALEFLIEALVDSHYKTFRSYGQRGQWTITGEDAVAAHFCQLAISAELEEPLRILRRNLDFFTKALGSAVCRRIWRKALEELNAMLWKEVLMSQRFTTLGAAQFARDMQSVFSTAEQYLPESSSSMSSLGEALKLLNLPVEAQQLENGEATANGISLKKAIDMVLTDNDAAKKLLEMLEMNSLTPVKARQILQRRMENCN